MLIFDSDSYKYAILCVVIAICGCSSEQPQIAEKFWIPSNISWEQPPAETGLLYSYASIGALYFSPDGKFTLMYWTPCKGILDSLSVGEPGFRVYTGKWKQLDPHTINIIYKLKYSALKLLSDNKYQEYQDTVSVISIGVDEKLLLKDTEYIATTMLTADVIKNIKRMSD